MWNGWAKFGVAVVLAVVVLSGFSVPLGSLLSLGSLLTALTVVLGILVGVAGALAGYTGSRLFVWAESPAVAESPKG